jgi:hypothetical protein
MPSHSHSHTLVTTHLSGNDKRYMETKNNSKHTVIEHDASLSRADTSSGDNHSFNETIWNETKSYFFSSSSSSSSEGALGDSNNDDNTITLAEAAAARAVRLKTAAATNPAFAMTEGDDQASLFETAFYLLVFGTGDRTGMEARMDWVRAMFGMYLCFLFFVFLFSFTLCTRVVLGETLTP